MPQNYNLLVLHSFATVVPKHLVCFLFFQPKAFTGKTTFDEVSPEVAYWPRIYENANPVEGSGAANDYQTLLLTSSDNGGEVVLDNFQQSFCDFWDENDFYLEDSFKLGVFPREKRENFIQEFKSLLRKRKV